MVAVAVLGEEGVASGCGALTHGYRDRYPFAGVYLNIKCIVAVSCTPNGVVGIFVCGIDGTGYHLEQLVRFIGDVEVECAVDGLAVSGLGSHAVGIRRQLKGVVEVGGGSYIHRFIGGGGNQGHCLGDVVHCHLDSGGIHGSVTAGHGQEG